jgi:hypothetical protein
MVALLALATLVRADDAVLRWGIDVEGREKAGASGFNV